MIRSFADRETELVWDGRISRRLPSHIELSARRRLRFLDIAASLAELGGLPSNRLQALKSDRAGQHSISINAQYRICFIWRDGGAERVEICDYH